MISLNGVKFTNGKRAMIDTLFDAKGTASGYYVKRRGAIHFYDAQSAPIAVINAAGVFGSAERLPNGRVLYSYATPRLIGAWASYSDGRAQVAAARQAGA
jgi:hypothetical protein